MNKNDPVDVLIIGAGASGAAVAWSLADTRMHILCLDQGGWINPAEYPSTGRDWEAKFYGDWSTSPNIRGRPEDYPINDDNSPIKVVNFNGVGGSTVMYTAHWPRLHSSDFKVKTLDGVADDWPIDYDALTPFFEENDRMMGVSGLSGDPLSPLTHPPMPPQPLGLSGPLIGKAMNKLGWHWWPSDTTVATMDYEGRARCINLGHCTPACAQGAKASTDITYRPHAIRAGVELKTHCRVREILTNEHGMASGVVYYDKDGAEQFQPAEVVIIACNGVGTPRLLLNSVSGRFPNGLANSSGLVGKNLMFHPYAQIYGFVKEPTDSNRAPPTCLWSKEFYDTMSRAASSAATASSSAAVQGRCSKRWRASRTAFCRGARIIIASFASSTAIASRSLRSARICPRSTTASRSIPSLKDGHGIPAPKIDYTLSENSRKMMAHGLARGREDSRSRGCYRPLYQQPHTLGRLAPARHRADGYRSCALRGQRMGEVDDVKKFLHRRRQRVRHVRWRQPNLDHPSDRALRCRPDEATPCQPLRLRPPCPQ